MNERESARVVRWVLILAAAVVIAAGCGDDDDGGDGDAGRRDSGSEMDGGDDDGGSGDGAVADGAASDGATADGGDGGAMADAGEPLTEAQSAAVLTEINAGEISAAELAETRADATAVQTYAELMITEHTAVQTMLDALADAESITPMANPVSMMVRMEAMSVRTALMPLDGAAFDRAYMQSQVMMHADALMLIDTRMLPGATDPEVRAFMMSVRAEVAEHLEMAESILAGLPAA